MIRSILLTIAFGSLGVLVAGCDLLGMGAPEPQQIPGLTAPIPGTPGQPTAPGVPTYPGQPVTAPIPGQPVPFPGQPVAAPMPGQPAPIPGQPVAAPIPGQPAPIPGQPVAVPMPGQPAVTPPQPPTPTGDDLTDKLNMLKFEQAQDMVPTSSLIKETLKKGKSKGYSVSLPGPPYCHTFIAVGEEGKVKNIDLKLEAPSGNEEAKDETEEETALILNHCPTTAQIEPYKLFVTVSKGTGEVAVQVFSK